MKVIHQYIGYIVLIVASVWTVTLSDGVSYFAKLVIGQDEVWRCRAGDIPLKYWNIIRTTASDESPTDHYVWTEATSINPIFSTKYVETFKVQPNDERWQNKVPIIPVYAPQRITLRVIQDNKHCHLEIHDERVGNVVAFFVKHYDTTK